MDDECEAIKTVVVESVLIDFSRGQQRRRSCGRASNFLRRRVAGGGGTRSTGSVTAGGEIAQVGSQ